MNRAFLFGDGFFESIRIISGNIPLLEQHLSRIADAIEILQIEPDFKLNPVFLNRLLNPKMHQDARARITFFREGGGRYVPESNGLAVDLHVAPCFLPFFLPIGQDLLENLDKAPFYPGTISIYPDTKPHHPIYTIKTISALYYVLAAKYKEKQKSDYLLLLNDQQHICEELNSNLILRKQGDDKVYIPSISSGGIFGATLRYLIANYKFQLLETEISVKSLTDYDAIYTCKASTGIIRIR